MIATFASLKWRLLINGIRRHRSSGTALAFLIVVGGGALLFVAPSVAISARTTDSATVYRSLAIGTYAVIFVTWTLGTTAVGGADETVDPSRLALLPLTRRQLVLGLGVAAVIGTGALATVFVLIGIVAGFAPSGPGAVLVVLAAVVGFVLAISASRTVATLLTQAQRSRRGRDITVLAAALGGATLWLGTQLIGNLNDDATNRLIDVLRWTPPGFVGQSVLEAARGSLLSSSMNLLAAVAWTVLFLVLWALSAGRLLVEQGASLRSAWRSENTGESISAWSRGSEIKAAFGKEVRYLVRSPSRRSVLVLNMVMGTAFTLLQLLQREGQPDGLVLIAPMAGLLFSLSAIDNQLGYDSAPMWMEVSAGGPRRAQFLGRSASWLPLVALPALPTALVVAALTGGWQYVPVAVALAVAGAGVPLGVGTMISVRAPYPIPDTGKPFSNPYANTGRGCAMGLLVLAALAVDAVLLAPAVVLVVAAQRVSLLWLCVTVVPVALWSIAIWWIGASEAARYVRGREPELLAALVERT